MEANEYQRLASRTLISEPDTTFTNDELTIMFATLKLGAAVGNVLEYIKKGICHRKGFALVDLDNLLFGVLLAVTNLAQCNSVEPPEYHLTDNEQMLIWCALGLGGEAGEVMDTISKLPEGEVDGGALVNELGDNDWYNAALCTLIDAPMSDVMQANINKLQLRYKNGYSSVDSAARVDVLQEDDTSET